MLAKRFILVYEAKIRSNGSRSFFTKSFHRSRPLTLTQARKWFSRLQKVRGVSNVNVKYAEGKGF